MDATRELIALEASASRCALATLAKCLLDSGALKPGQFSRALKGTFNKAGADWERPDYEYLRGLAKMVEEAEAQPKK